MRIGVVRTVGSPCRCAEAVAKGLGELGHEAFIVNSEEIELKATDLASDCDLVIDHTDTFRGRGFFRPLVRLLLESRGARIVGSDARTCFLADDKEATKALLKKTGISTPPGVYVTSKAWTPPLWLKPPFVVKPVFEHMSRGVGFAETEEEALVLVRNLLESLQQPFLVETYIPGQELAVSLLSAPDGLEVLPPLEWRPGTQVLTEAFKLKEPAGHRPEARRAELPPYLQDELKILCCRAFRALGLRDYARFDIRLSSEGTFFFLEANTTPSLEPLEAFALSARWAGLDYPGLVEGMLSAALRRYGKLSPEKKEVCIDLPSGIVKLEVPEGVHLPPPSSIDLALLLDVQPGEEVLELGCGSGLLSVTAAKLGARRVVAIDLDPPALEAATLNVRRNGVDEKIEIRGGSWYEALTRGNSVAPQGGKFDVIIATPPQTPGPGPFGPRYGGFDGTKHLFTILDKAPAFLKPDRGRLWLMAISLANPARLWERLQERFSEVSLVRETERSFAIEEYESMEKGLFEHFLKLRASGCSEFKETGSGRYIFRNLFIRASGPRIT